MWTDIGIILVNNVDRHWNNFGQKKQQDVDRHWNTFDMQPFKMREIMCYNISSNGSNVGTNYNELYRFNL